MHSFSIDVFWGGGGTCSNSHRGVAAAPVSYTDFVIYDSYKPPKRQEQEPPVSVFSTDESDMTPLTPESSGIVEIATDDQP